MALTSEGVYVSSHGKVSLFRDTNGDGKADKEEIIASGWPPTDVASGGVDATAVTLNRNGDIYFGLLTADYSNPYRVKDGVSHYDLNGNADIPTAFTRPQKRWKRLRPALRPICAGIQQSRRPFLHRSGRRDVVPEWKSARRIESNHSRGIIMAFRRNMKNGCRI